MSVWTIVVAAGSGTRYGGAKQFEDLNGRRVIDWSVGTARAVSDGVVVVTTADDVEADAVVPGGDTRAASVRNGLAAVPAAAEVILVHDAARPLATKALYESVVAAVRSGADGVIPAVAVVDTIKRVDSTGEVVETIDREQLRAVQTPQGFRAQALRDAHADAVDATDDAGLVERNGGRVIVVPGEADNIKITLPRDLRIAEALMSV